MGDIREPAPEDLVGFALIGLALFVVLMLGMLLLSEASALGLRLPRPSARLKLQLPGLLVGIGLAFFMVVALQAARIGRLPPGAAEALEQAQRLLAWH